MGNDFSGINFDFRALVLEVLGGGGESRCSSIEPQLHSHTMVFTSLSIGRIPNPLFQPCNRSLPIRILVCKVVLHSLSPSSVISSTHETILASFTRAAHQRLSDYRAGSSEEIDA